MTDAPDPRGDALPDARIDASRRRGALSLVWAIPVLAIAVSAFLIWQNYASRGALIEIAFDNASGVVAGGTQLRYRDVSVGVVEDVSFTESLAQVIVSVRVSEAVAPFIDDDARFYVVRPEISTRGVSGLETVLSGVYISGSWDLDASGLVTEHVGAAGVPLGDPALGGISIVLTGEGDDGLRGNVPILYKGVEVGRVGAVELDPSGLTTRAPAFVDAPYDKLVTGATRFWDASGFGFSLGPGGAALDVASIASLVNGGVVFDTVVSGGEAAPDGALFRLFPDETSARRSMFQNEGPNDLLRFTAVFSGDLGGLSTGATVELRGIEVGRVASLTGLVDSERFGDNRVRLLTTLELRPGQIGVNMDGDSALEFLQRRIESGLRARLVNASLLTSGLKVQLVDVPDAPPETLDLAAEPYPLLPTAPADVNDVTTSAEGLFDRLSGLPVEEVIDTAALFLDGIARFAQSPDLQELPAELRGLTEDVRVVIGAPGVQELPLLLNTTIAELNEILADIRAREVVEAFEIAADAAREAADDVTESIVEVPALIDELIEVGASLRALPIDEAVTQATQLLASVDAVVNQDSVRALPGELGAAVSDLRLVVADLRQADVAARLSETLAAAAEAASAFARATEGTPELIASLTGFADTAAGLPLAELTARAGDVLASVDGLIAQEDVQTLPAELIAAAASVRAILAEIEGAQVAATLTATLRSAGAAADDLAAAGAGAPELIASLTELSDTVGAATPELLDNVSALTRTARDLPLEALTARLADVLASADALVAQAGALVSQEGVQALPEELAATLSSVRVIAAELEEARIAASLAATLESASRAAQDVAAATQGVPELVDNVTALSRTARDLPLDALVTRLSDLTATADALIGSEDTAALPGELASTLAEITAVLAELRAGGTVANVNAALASARAAADNIAAAAEDLPSVTTRLNALLDQARGTIGAYGGGSDVNRAALQALRDAQSAADAISSLARAIERRPNSLLLGR